MIFKQMMNLALWGAHPCHGFFKQYPLVNQPRHGKSTMLLGFTRKDGDLEWLCQFTWVYYIIWLFLKHYFHISKQWSLQFSSKPAAFFGAKIPKSPIYFLPKNTPGPQSSQLDFGGLEGWRLIPGGVSSHIPDTTAALWKMSFLFPRYELVPWRLCIFCCVFDGSHVSKRHFKKFRSLCGKAMSTFLLRRKKQRLTLLFSPELSVSFFVSYLHRLSGEYPPSYEPWTKYSRP